MRDSQTSAWRTTTFGSIALRLVNGGTPPTDVPAFWNGTIPWITGADFISSGVGEFRRFVSKVAIASTATNVIDKGELLLVTRTGVGKLAIAPCDIAISQDITGVYADRKQVDALFLYHRMRKGVEELKKLNQGTSINGIIRGDLLKYPIDLPPLPQQERIAEILSTLDEAIEQTEALIAKMQAIKAGLMHDLFTRGVTANGELRPPREEAPQLYKASPLGWIPKEWSVCRVDEIAIKVTDGDHYTPQRQSSGVYLLSARNVLNGSIALDDVDHVGNVEYERMIKRCHPEPGDILISCSGTIGRTCIVPSWLKCCLVRSVALIQLDPTLCFPVFIEQLLQGSLLQRQIKASQRQAAQPNLFQGEISALLLPTPSLPEQKLCAARLEAINSQHMAECEHRDELDLLRHGLMHDLLTGRVPVSLPESEALTADA